MMTTFMTSNRQGIVFAWRLCLTLSLLAIGAASRGADPKPVTFRVGVASCDLTPTEAMPMWGYGERHDLLSQGQLDPLMAKALVIHAGDKKLALVGTDLGRGPTRAMMERIRRELKEKAGIEHVVISGSHSHHGPVIELTDKPGHGKGRFDAGVRYAQRLPELLIGVILDADSAAQPARMGLASKETTLNRNRHTKRLPKTTDPLLIVMRFDNEAGQPLATLVNFAAHPTMIDAMTLKYSADYPGHMKRKVEAQLGGQCVFMQGAAGDMSANSPPGVDGPQGFGEALAEEVLALARGIETRVPEKPSLKGQTDQFLFSARLDVANPLVMAAFGRAFFPDLVRNFADECQDGIPVELNTLLLNGEIAMVTGSGEFFSNHAVRLRPRVYLPHTLFFGYANGHSMYLPTIEATSEGGYGADPMVSHVELGAGELMMNRALINIYGMLNKVNPRPSRRATGPPLQTAGTQP